MDCSTCGLVDKFRDLVLDFTWEQLCYLIYYHKNMEQFNEKLEQLTNKRISIQNRKEEAENNVLQVEEEVLLWLSNVDEISDKVQKLLEKNREKGECSLRSCPNPWLRYQLSKTAKEMTQEISEICGRADFPRVAHRLPPPSLIELPTGVSNGGIDSRVQIKSQIIEALRDPSVKMVGLCGLGGVGKTTIAIDVAKEEEIQKKFNKVIMATVSQENNIGKIQDQIIDKLGMQLNVKNEEVKAFRLRERLKQEKNMFLILDDLWEELELSKIGIPFVDVDQNSENEGCKILLTSRNEILLSNSLKCQKIIKVGVLSEDEAWNLFERIVGVSNDSSIKSTAIEIVQKCGGLPLAIATAAKALKQKKGMHGWKDYLTRLKHLKRSFTGIKEVDTILRLSYDDLSQENKKIFLLAAMMSHDPLIEDLVMYSVGLDILEHTVTIADARGVIFDVVGKLKSLNLFLDSFSMLRFSIHDVYRDWALSEASDEFKAVIVWHRRLHDWPDEDRLEHCRGICLQKSDISDLIPEMLYGPMLEWFFLDGRNVDLAIPDMFFKSSKKLKLLALTNVHFSSLASLRFLEKIKALCLHSCVLEDITEVRSLRKLKVLSLAHSKIEELPIELAELTSLQMLNLSDCYKLKVIPQNLLSNLKKLEALYMRKSFDGWNDKQSIEANKNASLDELSDLPISSLDIRIPNVSMLPKNLFLHMKLERYEIVIGNWQWGRDKDKSSKILRLEQESGFYLTDGIQKLLREVEDLHLYGSNGHQNVLHNHDGRGFPCLKHLQIESNDDIKYIVLNSAQQEHVFPILETLELQNLKVLENLCEGGDAEVEFPKLHTLKMVDLPTLTGNISLKLRATNSPSNKLYKSLFNTKMLFPKLEILTIFDLNESISLIWDNQISHSSFSNLKTIIVKSCGFEKLVPFHVLKSLNNLEEVEVSDCDMLETVFDFENFNDNEDIASLSVVVPLKKLKLNNLPKLKNVWSNHYCPGNVSFSSLRSVYIYRCGRLTSIFPASIAKHMLGDLEDLNIYNCDVEVIVAKDQASESVAVTFEFPKLNFLHLGRLSKLRNFYPQKHKLELPCLQELCIGACDELEIFEKEVSSSSISYEEETIIDLKYPLLSHDKVILPKLEILELSNLKELISLIWDNGISLNSFSNLTKITVERCGIVKLVPFHLLKSLNKLEEVEVKYCDMLETVFDFENLNDNEDIVSLSMVVSLKKLVLWNLPKLKNVWSNHYCQGNVSFPNLRSVEVDGCTSLTSIFPVSIAKDMLGYLEKLRIADCDIEVIVAKDQVLESVAVTFEFPKLTSLQLARLSKLRNFYPHKHKLELSCLQELSIRDCDELEIFEKEISCSSGTCVEETTIDLKYPLIHNSFNNLKTLTVDRCDFIKLVPLPVLKLLNNLEKLEVSYCDRLEKVFGYEDLNDYYKERGSSSAIVPLNIKHLEVYFCLGLTTLMTSTAARSLVHLTHLKIRCCNKIEEIITKEEGGDDEDQEIIFTKMEFLKLVGLPRLKSFCGYNYTFRFPLLEQLSITGCPQLTMFCLGQHHASRLHSVRVNEYPHIDIWKTDLNNTIRYLFTFPEVITRTRSMVLNAKNIKTVQDVFPEVRTLFVESFMKEGVTFPFSSIERFPKMGQLYVENSSFEEIFPSQDEISAFEGNIPSLTELYIAHLDKLKNIWKDGFQLPSIHQNLEVIEVKSCCNLNKLAPSYALFENLSLLSISGCHQLIYLVTISTAKSLVSLERLEIHDCKEMEEVVMNETNEDVEGAILFNKLWKIELTDIPSLNMFSQTPHSFEFPELKEVKITGCPEMKMLCPGRLETPKKPTVKIEEHDIEMENGGDLNKVIQENSYAKDKCSYVEE